MLIGLLFENPAVFFLVVAALVISLSIHEFAHAYVADKLGDDTARLLGRVTLDPRSHLDPVGSLMLLFAGFGWGRPVPFNPINLKNPKRDSAIIAFAGPLSNFILFFAVGLIFKIIGGSGLMFHLGSGGNLILLFLSYVLFYNIVLGVFNLLPIHPLDGFKVVAGLLPNSLYFQWMQMQQYGVFLLLILIVTGATSVILEPFIGIFLNLLSL